MSVCAALPVDASIFVNSHITLFPLVDTLKTKCCKNAWFTFDVCDIPVLGSAVYTVLRTVVRNEIHSSPLINSHLTARHLC